MKIGDLVKITQARIGLPLGKLGLVTGTHHVKPSYGTESPNGFTYFLVQFPDKSHTRATLPQDLEVVSV